jgi:hypothetical protein
MITFPFLVTWYPLQWSIVKLNKNCSLDICEVTVKIVCSLQTLQAFERIYELDDRSLIPSRSRNFSLLHHIQTDFVTQPAPIQWIPRAPSRVCESFYSCPSSAKVKVLMVSLIPSRNCLDRWATTASAHILFASSSTV